MSKEDLIDAIIMARINEARKGYSVKGSGVEKKYLLIESENIKYLETLKLDVSGMKYLEHAKWIEDRIDTCDEKNYGKKD